MPAISLTRQADRGHSLHETKVGNLLQFDPGDSFPIQFDGPLSLFPAPLSYDPIRGRNLYP
jgi:hypothetical protein